MPDQNDPNRENRERLLKEGQEASEHSRKEFAERTRGRPTPTQEENDRAKLGEHVLEHEPDGGEADPYHERNLEAQRGARTGYDTRHMSPQSQHGAPRQPQQDQRDQRARPPGQAPSGSQSGGSHS
jgi:hypothetical protein